jgi:hypothetical protein
VNSPDDGDEGALCAATNLRAQRRFLARSKKRSKTKEIAPRP